MVKGEGCVGGRSLGTISGDARGLAEQVNAKSDLSNIERSREGGSVQQE